MKEIVAELLESIIFRYHDYFYDEKVGDEIKNVWETISKKLRIIIDDLRGKKDDV